LTSQIQVQIQEKSNANPLPPSSAPLGSEDESTIKVAPTKKDKPNGTIKLKKPAPKHNKPGNWRDGSVIDGMWDTIELRLEVAGRARLLTFGIISR
jgi:hypothetical protein